MTSVLPGRSFGATIDQAAAWSPAPWRRTRTGPLPPLKTVCGPTGDAIADFERPADRSARLPDAAYMASGLIRAMTKTTIPASTRKRTAARRSFTGRRHAFVSDAAVGGSQVIRNATPAWLYPTPEPIMTTRSPFFTFPSSRASSRAIGMQAEPV